LAAVIASRSVHLPGVGVSPASSTRIVVAWTVAEAATANASAVRRARLSRADLFIVFSQSRTVEPFATRNKNRVRVQFRCGTDYEKCTLPPVLLAATQEATPVPR